MKAERANRAEAGHAHRLTMSECIRAFFAKVAEVEQFHREASELEESGMLLLPRVQLHG